MRPRLLDLFCGAGGCSMGYHEAGFDVVGVDNRPMPRYPFEFHQADALVYVGKHGADYDVIHASPPCQAYTALKRMWVSKKYPDLVLQTRNALRATGKLYIIENVPGAPLDVGLMLCGSMFGLGVDKGFLRRHRLFETTCLLTQPDCRHRGPAVGVYGHGGLSGKHRMLHKRDACDAMEIHWMTRDELTQAIPPAYTKFIGKQLIQYLNHQEGRGK